MLSAILTPIMASMVFIPPGMPGMDSNQPVPFVACAHGTHCTFLIIEQKIQTFFIRTLAPLVSTLCPKSFTFERA